MSTTPTPGPHLEIERVADSGDAWQWSIYDGKDGPLIQMSEHRYSSSDAARRIGDKAVLAIRMRSAPEVSGDDV
ncbi:hypothetical protein MKK67_29055 [Methylobacterium sp. J-072]|uniref:hypothetical protein n=1 Tax=Methylobacterium sp. J-072 TaxID=2836651 RepID=UPI001FB94B3B|nr:hypothetical protein [Methylobacterium sp. J-072]MCJ2096525.1 hypothetical protein [Methylobacterium sp. J-072]